MYAQTLVQTDKHSLLSCLIINCHIYNNMFYTIKYLQFVKIRFKHTQRDFKKHLIPLPKKIRKYELFKGISTNSILFFPHTWEFWQPTTFTSLVNYLLKTHDICNLLMTGFVAVLGCVNCDGMLKTFCRWFLAQMKHNLLSGHWRKHLVCILCGVFAL